MEKENKNYLVVKYFAVGQLETNCIFIIDPESLKTCIVDPGADSDIILSELKSEGLTPDKIIITHGHYDHIGALEDLVKETGVPVFIHKNDEPLLRDSTKNFSAFLGKEISYKGHLNFVEQGSRLYVGAFPLEIVEIPGHTQGSIGLKADGFLVAGDTLFAGGVGRTDLPGASETQLIKSIKEKILSLPDETVVYPGHGPETTVREEKNDNPFLI